MSLRQYRGRGEAPKLKGVSDKISCGFALHLLVFSFTAAYSKVADRLAPPAWLFSKVSRRQEKHRSAAGVGSILIMDGIFGQVPK
jgi:hypothetical protein